MSLSTVTSLSMNKKHLFTLSLGSKLFLITHGDRVSVVKGSQSCSREDTAMLVSSICSPMKAEIQAVK